MAPATLIRVWRPSAVNQDPFNACPGSDFRPEGPAGALAATPDSATMTVTLPSVGPADTGALDSEELRLVGLINQARARAGAPPLELAQTLNRAEAAYARLLTATGRFDHCTGASPTIRALDAGWPDTHAAGEVLEQGDATGRGAFTALMASPAHRGTLLDPEGRYIGVGRDGLTWAATVADQCADPARCEPTGSYGSSPADDGSGTGPREPGTGGRRALRVNASAHRRAVKLTVTATPASLTGRVTCSATAPGRHAVRDRARLTRGRARCELRLRPGRWKLRAALGGLRSPARAVTVRR